MIVFDKQRFFTGVSSGVIENHSFRCALVTDDLSAVVSVFSGEWNGGCDHPVAEAFFPSGLSRKEAREIHGMLLKQLDWCGRDSLDLAAAIEKVFGQARNKNIVTRYKNNAALLLPGSPSGTEREALHSSHAGA